VRADAAHGAGVGVDGLGPKAFELQVLQVESVLAGKGLWKVGRFVAAGVLGHRDSPWWSKGCIPHNRGMQQHHTGSGDVFELRVAASSNPFEFSEADTCREYVILFPIQ